MGDGLAFYHSAIGNSLGRKDPEGSKQGKGMTMGIQLIIPGNALRGLAIRSQEVMGSFFGN